MKGACHRVIPAPRMGLKLVDRPACRPTAELNRHLPAVEIDRLPVSPRGNETPFGADLVSNREILVHARNFELKGLPLPGLRGLPM